MSQNCDDSLERMYLYIDNELDAASAEVIRYHISDCPPCSDVFSFEERLKVVVRTRLAEDVPADLLDRLRAVIRAENL